MEREILNILLERALEIHVASSGLEVVTGKELFWKLLSWKACQAFCPISEQLSCSNLHEKGSFIDIYIFGSNH